MVQNETKLRIRETIFFLTLLLASPGFYKVFDEILVNAIDNHARDSSTKRIDINLPCPGEVEPLISIRNDGRGIPVTMHNTEKIYIPQLIFGHLLTGSNFRDNNEHAERLTGGRHGYGAKLTNIFSNEFQVYTADARRRLEYRQSWSQNMRQYSDPLITKLPQGGKDLTQISFRPDIQRFGLSELSEDMVRVLMMRAWDVAGCNHGRLDVYLNNVLLDTGGLETFFARFTRGPAVAMHVHKRWDVSVGSSPEGRFEHISYVNGAKTLRGGEHVSHVVQPICEHLAKHINKKNKGVAATPAAVKKHLLLFVNAKIELPHFDSQTKELLITKVRRAMSYFGVTT